MELSAGQLESNWNKYLKIVNTFISGERKDKLLNLYNELSEEIIMSPASSKVSYHNAFPGGYLDHVLRVIHCSLKVKGLWEEMGGIIDFTDEELVFTALNHDLGKIGGKGTPGYIPQTDKWRQDKLGEIYTMNRDIDFMLANDRSLFLLQKYGIAISEKEYLAIKLHGGLYDESNKAYYISYNPESKLKSNLTHILHQADFLASKIESDKN